MGKESKQRENTGGIKKDEAEPSPTRYVWLVLGVLLFMSVCNQWQRYTIGYVQGYKIDKTNKEELENPNKY